MGTQYKPAIHFQHVDYRIGDIEILNDITGSFPQGRITTLVGPSGAGKSTLLKLCNGLISPANGEIFVKDKAIGEYDPVELRRMVGMALQSAPMISGTVYENLNLPLELQGQQLAKEDALELLEDVGLKGDLLDRKVKELSGGQRQKVSIARTLVNKPEILLMDEITSSLDRASKLEVEELISKINRKYKTTIIWITHNLQQALEIGDYTWVMMDGQVVETGESSLLEDPQNQRVNEFVKGVVS
ncbi:MULTISPECIES: phosphate ABC transporter ATP-binding protein [unclassified Planococcus (in: firmicutes)]|uniref:ABC transporter ATP-binding protein n=1 Tax=unclassified Planococcus (in: firmicutes) TaxID=2662419 RepID=UPI000C321BB0|nr:MULTISPECIES: phosphate ABC transporter ATP-binding protein [unclassified Planococcus (in: firmicutes)]AUD12752.1 phosphate ABC transporter ATP-binding protein [Planococcus sp. MB-3u-03]PKG46720.1 phosphate ABC transporter ATP-binding protein [Planococcus sp. Urea-trap-24]PKG89565.1 phosphate ABC transporter ATP-binding protein [Planococcus sp. Urea-3u-39]PKH36126.1 phosphate ABC transporter ATP-binding protein [Planococcus sp. MB-3u-09]